MRFVHRDPVGCRDHRPQGSRFGDRGARYGVCTRSKGAGRIDATATLRKQGMERAAAVAILLTFATVTFAAPGLRAVPPEQLDHYWWMTNTEIDADVPNFGRNLDKPTCAAVTYEIGADGVTRGIVVRRVVPAGDLGQVAKSAVADLHYAPAPDN